MKRLIACALVAAAAALLAGGSGGPARAARGARTVLPDIDLTNEGFYSFSQRDPRWRSFGAGPRPTNDVTLGRCGCYLTTLASVIQWQIGGLETLPWYEHFERDPVTGTFVKAFSWAPPYIDQYLSIGPNPDKPRNFGWGFDGGGGGTCGFSIPHWALTEVGNPVVGAGGAAGVEIDAHPGLATEVIDANLLKGEPTIVVVRNSTGGYHAQLVVGWSDEFKGYRIVDPMQESPPGSPAGSMIGGENDLGDGSQREHYDKWVASVNDTRVVRPVFAKSKWLWLLDDPEPIELLSIDPSGRREGFDASSGRIVHEDPRASYETFTSWTDPIGQLPTDDPKRSLVVKNPVVGTYGFEVLGTGDGPFTLRFGTTVGDQAAVAKTVTGTISKGQVLRYEVDYSPSGGAAVRQVEHFAPRARAGNDFTTFVSQPVRFDGTSSYDVGSSIASWAWDFGDGASASGPSVTHAYGAPGTYVAKLTVTSARGLTASDTRIVRVVGVSAAETLRASVTAAGSEVPGDSLHPAISADGRYVAFESSADLATDGVGGTPAIFVKDLQTGAVDRVSVSTAGAHGDGESPAISADGRFVPFVALADNLVAGDSNGVADVFVRDRVARTTVRVSVASDGTEANGASSSRPAISADGRFVAFASAASNLVPDDANAAPDVFVRDLQTGTTERVSVSSTGEQQEFGRGAGVPAISADGRYVAFVSGAENLVPALANGWPDVFVRDRQLDTTEVASVSSSGAAISHYALSPTISADGRYVAFASEARDVVEDDRNLGIDVFVRDRVARTTELASLSSEGLQSNAAHSFAPALSPNGRFVAFYSSAENLVADDGNAGGPNHGLDVFVRDRTEGTTERASVSTSGQEALPDVGFFATTTQDASISDDGAVAFQSSADNLVSQDRNFANDVFVRRKRGGGAATGPLANVSGPYVGWASHPVRLDAGSSRSLAGGPLTATWDFGDGTPRQTGGLEFSHVYQQPGVYTVAVTVNDGAHESEAAATTVEVLPALGADSISVTPSCGDGGTQVTVRGLAKGPAAALLDGGWDLAEGPFRPADVQLVLPGGSASATPVPATLVFERTLTLPAGLASGSHTIAVAGGPAVTFVAPCPAAGDRRPVAHAGGPLYSGSIGKPVTFDGSASRDPEGEPLTYAWDFGDGTAGTGARPRHSYAAAGVYFVSLVVNDGRHDSATGIGTRGYALALIKADDVPPTTTAKTSPAPNAAGWNRTDVTVVLTATDNEGGSGVKEIVYALAGAESREATVAGSSAELDITAEGVTTVTYFARDNARNAEQPRTLTIRIDRTAPTLTCTANPSRLWPPDHRLVAVDVSVTITDALAGGAGFVLVAAKSSEPDEGLGDGDTPRDIQGFVTGTPDTSGKLRAERSGAGVGRTYHLTHEGADSAGNRASCTSLVVVPRDGSS